MICDVSFDCGRCQFRWSCDEWMTEDDYDDEDDYSYPPCDNVEDCVDCSHEKECFPNL